MKTEKTVHIQQLVKKLTDDRVISFVFNPGERSESPIRDVMINYLSFVPLLEAIGMYMKSRLDDAFDKDGKMIYPDRILDMNGVIVLLQELLMQAEFQQPLDAPVRPEAFELIGRVIQEMLPLVGEAVDYWD